MSKEQKTGIFYVVLIVVVFTIALLVYIYIYATSHRNDDPPIAEVMGDNAELLELLSSDQEPVIEEEENEQIPEQSEEYNESELQNDKRLSEEPIELTDIYTESGSTAVFQCFNKEAASYEWEYYDLDLNKWSSADPADVYLCEDELYRNVSNLKVNSEINNHEMMVRCIIHFSGKADEIQTASLFLLRDQVEKIEIEDLVTDVNCYLSARKLPVKVTYKDGTNDTITGLNNLYFIISEEKKDHSTSISGNRIETTILTTTECNYLYVGMEEKEIPVRYRTDISEIDASVKITGTDLNAPVISDVTISPYEVSNVDKPVTLSVNIIAEDKETPYPKLEYAFLLADEQPTETDWNKKSSFDVSIEKNGIYAACVRDGAGNIAKLEKEIITVDTKAPVISSVSLAVENNWCQSNTIIVNAKDAGKMSYCYTNMSDDSSSDWISYNEYSVDNNGIWMIQVRDEVGNLSETEIEIDNIDSNAPIIRNITIK